MDQINYCNRNELCITRQMHSDSKKHRSFVALPFAAGDLQRYAAITTG